MLTPFVIFRTESSTTRQTTEGRKNLKNDPVNGPVNDLLELIKDNPGIKKPTIITHIGRSKATLTRYLKQLLDQNLIEYKGSDKTGGYYLKK